MQAARQTALLRASDGGAMHAPWEDYSRREVVIGGMSSLAAARALSAQAATASSQAPVTPVNITPKETVELGKSGAERFATAHFGHACMPLYSAIALCAQFALCTRS
jgi:hypothetical protein